MISKRLLIISQHIESSDVVADIGTDSGELPFHLVKNGHNYVYASDNKRGPYDNLVKKISDANLSSKIDARLEDGLNNLPPKINTIIIAGMGGELIKSILVNGRDNLGNIKKLVLAPNRQEPVVRQTLVELGFTIVDEEVIKDGKHYYEIIIAKPGLSTLTIDEVLFGPVNLAKKTSTFREKWAKIYLKNTHLLKQAKLSPYREIEILQTQERIKSLND
jgi:tRNA (adenine22-N1)-methyltransferase